MNETENKLRVFLEKASEIINQKGIVSSVISEPGIDGSMKYALRVTEDPNSICKATIRFDKYEKVYEEFESEEKCADAVISQIIATKSPVRSARLELENLKYDQIKNRIYPCIMDKNNYKGYLKTVAYRDYLDFALVYCYKTKETPLTVTNKIAETLGVSEQQLYDDSTKNIVPKGPINIRNLFTKEALVDMGYGGPGYDEKEDISMYVLSNEDLMGGTNVILVPEFLEEVSKKLGSDYYVLTSTNDFVGVVPNDKKWGEIKEMLRFNEKVSEGISDQDSKLTGKVYYYRSQSRKLEKI